MEDLRDPRYTRSSRNGQNNGSVSKTKLNKLINILLLIIILIQSFTISYLIRNPGTAESQAASGNNAVVATPSPAAPTEAPVQTTAPPSPTGTAESAVASQNDAPTIVCLGDSIFQKSENNDGIANQLASLTGATVYNCAISGTQAANVNNYDMEIAPSDAFNLSNMVNSITSNDYGLQHTYLSDFAANGNGHAEAIATLENLDFMQVDIITLAYGTNDFFNNCTIDNSKSPLDNATTLGALRYAIGRIQEYYPHIRIIVLSPPFCYTSSAFSEMQTCDELDFGNGTLFDYAANYRQIAIDYGVEFVDVLNDAGMNRNNIASYVIDGVHLNSTGKELVAQLLAKQLQQGSN